MPEGENFARIDFCLIPEAYLAGQTAGKLALKKAPNCHEICTTNAMLSFYLGALIPMSISEVELRRLAPLVLPRLVESIAIISGMGPECSAGCCPPSHNETLN
jgi:hypothetical protein